MRQWPEPDISETGNTPVVYTCPYAPHAQGSCPVAFLCHPSNHFFNELLAKGHLEQHAGL
jgi:hypothetical protein